MKIIICDDDISVLESIKQTVTAAFGQKHCILCCESADEMKTAAADGADLNADLLIIDIRLKDENGINAAHFMSRACKGIFIIFITAFPEEYYEDIFSKVKPYGFLAKPVKTDRLVTYIDEIDRLLEGGRGIIAIRFNGDSIHIRQDEIIYLESEKRQLIIHCKDKVYSSYGKLQEVEQSLETRFIRCHKSFIVNLDSVIHIKKGEFLMENGDVVPISRQYEKSVRIRYFTERGNIQ